MSSGDTEAENAGIPGHDSRKRHLTIHITLRALLLTAVVIACLVIGIALTSSYHHHKAKHPPSPVPAAISSAVAFPIYVPDTTKLPAGYRLDTNSFTNPVPGGVNYTVSYGSGKKLVFSLQIKPADKELDSFVANYIPLNISFDTPLGTARLGAYDTKGVTKTLASLPISGSKTWVVVTGPYDTDQPNLKQVLRSLYAD